MSPTFWDTSFSPPHPPPQKSLLWFCDLLNMEWHANMNSVIISSLEMPFALLFFFFFQINYVITEESLWSSPKNSMLLPDPGTIIMPCEIKTETASPANCECPCLYHKEIAKCTQEGSSQSNWEGRLNSALLSKHCPWVRTESPGKENRGGEPKPEAC